ncbi:MAG: FAD-dependent oxidoreductase, partial [Pirellulaceae bacterium]|nr:FAD-dependent oxidoreductase [Pirellulaceae bacterium]
KSRRLSRSQVLAHISTLDKRQCAHGILYHDGQFDDARLLINLAQTAVRHSACLINYARVDELTKSPGGPISGVRWTDLESGESTDSQARVVINATGPFCDAIRRMDDRQAAPMVAASQGVHLVFPKRFLPGKTAMMVPKTSDGRVVFLIPWHDAVVLGTTDTAIDSVSLEPRAQAAEIDFLLETVAGYLPDSPTRADVLSVFTGIRPLVVANPGARTSRLPRDHTINISGHGLVTITGGKWTTYRKMAEDCVNRAAEYAQLAARPCRTRSLAIAGAPADGATAFSGKWSVYGSDAALIEELSHTLPGSDEPLDSRLPITPSQIVWAVRHEMARTVEDVLARRTRALFLNAQAALDIAPRVAQIMEQELAGKSPVESGQNSQWQTQQLAEFSQTARCFLL